MSHYNVNASVAKMLIQHLIRFVASSGEVDESTARVLHAILATVLSPELIPTRAARAPQERTKLFSDFRCPTEFLEAYGQHFPKTVASSRWSPRRRLRAPRDFCKMRWRLEWSLGIRTDLEQGWKRLFNQHGS